MAHLHLLVRELEVWEKAMQRHQQDHGSPPRRALGVCGLQPELRAYRAAGSYLEVWIIDPLVVDAGSH